MFVASACFLREYLSHCAQESSASSWLGISEGSILLALRFAAWEMRYGKHIDWVMSIGCPNRLSISNMF